MSKTSIIQYKSSSKMSARKIFQSTKQRRIGVFSYIVVVIVNDIKSVHQDNNTLRSRKKA